MSTGCARTNSGLGLTPTNVNNYAIVLTFLSILFFQWFVLTLQCGQFDIDSWHIILIQSTTNCVKAQGVNIYARRCVCTENFLLVYLLNDTDMPYCLRSINGCIYCVFSGNTCYRGDKFGDSGSERLLRARPHQHPQQEQTFLTLLLTTSNFLIIRSLKMSQITSVTLHICVHACV